MVSELLERGLLIPTLFRNVNTQKPDQDGMRERVSEDQTESVSENVVSNNSPITPLSAPNVQSNDPTVSFEDIVNVSKRDC